jgi:hypothetical protein
MYGGMYWASHILGRRGLHSHVRRLDDSSGEASIIHSFLARDNHVDFGPLAPLAPRIHPVLNGIESSDRMDFR